jgi:hypothetical protein
MNQLIVSAASLAAVTLLIGFAYLLGFRGRQRVDAATVRSHAHAYAPDTLIVRIRIDRHGRSGLAELIDGRVITVIAMGARTAARLWQAEDVRFETMGRGIRVRLPDLGYPQLQLEEAA